MGLVPADSYSFGESTSSGKSLGTLGQKHGPYRTGGRRKVLEYAAVKNGQVVNSFIQDYSLDLEHVTFVGGGGGAASVVPPFGQNI